MGKRKTAGKGRKAKKPKAGERLESKAKRAARLEAVVGRLKRVFPDADCSLDYENPLQLLVATILSAQCTDERVNAVTPGLFDRYPTAAHFAQAELEELESAIHSTGFFRNKAKNIRACCAALVEHFGGNVPGDMVALTELDGVGRKTANVVLGTAFGKAEGVVVDTHVKRLSGLLKLTGATVPEKIEQDLMAILPREHWVALAHLFIRHGRATCKARAPACDDCCLADLCPSAGAA